MITFLTIVHVMVSVFLILVVLLQQGKGQDLAGAFGGGGSQANVGARSATTVLHRLTTVAAVMFMVTSLTLTIMISSPGSSSVISEDAVPAPIDVPIPADPEQAEPVAPDTDVQPDGAPEEGAASDPDPGP